MTSAALYARVSSARQKKDETIASQTAALRGHAQRLGLQVPDEWVFEDEGHSGATLVRPALERLRDLVAGVGIDVVLCYSPDRLARKFAYQALLLEEFARAGTRVEFVKGPRGDSPEDQLLVQFQGMFAEYEKAQIMERYRRGKAHRARTGSINVLSGAPFGYRYVRKSDHTGAAYQVVEHEAALVAELFRRYADDGASIADLARWLTSQNVPTRTGKQRWDRSVIWGMLRNPAYAGTAVFGKTMVVAESAGLNRVARLQARAIPAHPRPSTGPASRGPQSRCRPSSVPTPSIGSPVDWTTTSASPPATARSRRCCRGWPPAQAAATATTAPRRAPPTRRSTTTGVWARTTTATRAAGCAPTNRSAPTTSTRWCGITSPGCSPTHSASAPRSTGDSTPPAPPIRLRGNAKASTPRWPRRPPRSPA
jgi:DNA invertase Pin-like site-specific DNA recombinase